MGQSKIRNAYGLQFTTKDLQLASGRTRAAIHTMISEEHGLMEDVCRRLGFNDAEQLGRALDAVREPMDAAPEPMDEDAAAAVNAICDILGVGGEPVKAEKMTAEPKADGKEKMVALMDGYEAAIDAMDEDTRCALWTAMRASWC